ncbi:triple tyrosine motif-containing protein [Luteibacter yeojuensis]
MPLKTALIMLALSLGSAGRLLAAQAEPPPSGGIQPSQYVHQSWTIKDGAPPAICAMTQGPDGYLWLGTGAGLYRFDGVEFSRYQPPSGQHLVATNLTALHFTSDGGLWIGSYDGGATLLKDGNVRSWGTRDGFPAGWVNNFSSGLDGEVWAATGQGLGRFSKGRWQAVGANWNYPADRADWVAVDHDGTLWVAAVDRLVYLPRGARQFASTNFPLAPGAVLGVDGEGRLWASDHLYGTRRLDGLSAAHPNLRDSTSLPASGEYAAARMAFDRGGGLWATSRDNASVFHVPRKAWPAPGASISASAVADTFQAPLELTSNHAIAVTVDAEGTVWVGTGIGIDSYHLSQVGTLRDFDVEPKAHLGISADSVGQLQLSSFDTIYALEEDSVVPEFTGVSDAILSTFRDSDDSLWVIGFHDLFHHVEGRLEKLPLPNGLDASRIKFVAPAPHGVIWASIEGLGIYQLKAGTWHPQALRTKGLEVSPTSIAVDAAGATWFGYADSTLLYLDERGTEQVFRFRPGEEIGTVSAMTLGRFGVLFGGSAGLATLRNGRLVSLTNQDFPALTGITGMVEEPNGDVWINAGRGLLHFTATELERAFADPGYRPAMGSFDFRDGIQGSARQGQPVTTILRSNTGRIWFLTNENAYWIDPPRGRRNLIPPPVYIKSILANERRLEPRNGMILPAGTSALQLGYTALSLTSPTRVRFRYRLAGEDADWVDPGTRRQAYYTNLAPGTYRFDVIASNDQGIWNERGASLSFTIRPRYYQTWWFHLVEALFVAAIVGAAYALRVRYVARTIRLQTSARHEERERIARELHDTLLQAIYGIVLKFQAIAAAMPDDDVLKKDIKGTLQMAGDFIIEGRDRVKDLRSRLASTHDLVTAILDLARVLQDASDVSVETDAHVTDHPMDPAVGDEILAICRESLINALRHAEATRIFLELSMRGRDMRIRVVDDGVGISPGFLENTQATGHWGIAGMRERAERIGAHLSIRSVPGGTTIELTAPLRLPPKRVRLRDDGTPTS